MKYKIVEEYNFEVNEPSKLKLAAILPSDGPYQEIKDMEIEWEGDSEIIDYGKVQIARVTGELKNSSCIKIKYTAEMKTGKIIWDDKVISQDTQHESGIESNEDLIINTANSITKGTSLSDVKRIYNFVNEHIKWPTGNRISYGENIQSALTALETEEGVCGEFANLMVALCRAKGIPAKSISGLAMPLYPDFKKRNWNHQAGSHAWVEFFSDGQWHFADPAWGGEMNFDNIDGLHLSYGQSSYEKKIYDKNIEWAEADYHIIGAMSAPLKFVASTSSKNVTIRPVGFIDNSTRDIFIRIIIISIIVIVYVVRRRKIKTTSSIEFTGEDSIEKDI